MSSPHAMPATTTAATAAGSSMHAHTPSNASAASTTVMPVAVTSTPAPVTTEVSFIAEDALAAAAGVEAHPHIYHQTGHDADNEGASVSGRRSQGATVAVRSSKSDDGAVRQARRSESATLAAPSPRNAQAAGTITGAAKDPESGAATGDVTLVAAEEEGEPDKSIKLGLGDFVFYSVLVSRAALYDMSTMAACFVAVIMGLGSTLFLLGVFKKALPALPISIFFGVAFYFLTRIVVVPMIIELSTNGMGV